MLLAVARRESCEEGRERTKDKEEASVKGLPYMPCQGTWAIFCWVIRSRYKFLSRNEEQVGMEKTLSSFLY